MTPQQKKTIQNFYQAATKQDALALRALLTDNFRFQSTMMSFDNPDDYVAHLSGFCGHINNARTVAQENTVVHMATLHTQVAGTDQQIPLCDVFTFDGDKIASQELFADSALFPRAK